MVKVGIIGATGYAGGELVRILMNHKEAEIVWYGSRNYADQEFGDIYRNFFDMVDTRCVQAETEEQILTLADEVDIIFTATPQGFCSKVISETLLNKVKIIDLSADFRIKDIDIYEKWYDLKHPSKTFVEKAVYGLCEVNRNEIKSARLIANPGCYPTCTVLSIYPLLKEGLIEIDSIIVDAKSGASGAGRGGKVANLYCEINENGKAYAVAKHRHTPEIEEQLSVACGENVIINFTPHLLPMNRGILATSYAKLKREISYEEVKTVYDSYYKDEKFVRVLKEDIYPETRWVEGSNYVDVNFKIDSRTKRIVIMGAMDNLVKGAAGQAVQNMNIMYGFKETEGLEFVPLFP